MGSLAVDARCFCSRCEAYSHGTYQMIGHCRNCGQGNVLIVIRQGDRAPRSYGVKCPVCGTGGYGGGIVADRLAGPDEVQDVEGVS